ncbi:hypothetical protein PV350_05970 [Streptomyces sp. PA03-6a]|nr:hypothetical protein [Streptomyces sp. PA03-6a]
MTWRAGRRISFRGVLLLLGVLVFTSIHLVACAHGPDRTGGDTLTAGPAAAAPCQPQDAATRPDQDVARGDGPPADHHALCGVALDRLPDPRPRLADTPTVSGIGSAPAVPAPAIHPPKAGAAGAGRPCAPARSGPGTLSLLCVSRT